MYWVGQWLANFAATGEPSVPMPEMRQGTRMGWGIYQLFEASDGEQVFIGITSNAHWGRFCKEFGLGDLLADEGLDDNAKRVAARGWLPARIGDASQAHFDGGQTVVGLDEAGVEFEGALELLPRVLQPVHP